MSLINEALKQARTQVPGNQPSGPPPIPVYTPPAAPSGNSGCGGFVVAVVLPLAALVIIMGGALFWYSSIRGGNTAGAPAGAAVQPPTNPQAAGGTQAVPGKTPKMLEFYADWCGPCRTMKPAVEQFTKAYAGRIAVETINVDTNKELAQKYNVTSIPLQVYLDTQGREVYRNVGAVPADAIAAKWEELHLLPPALPRQAVSEYGKDVQKARTAAAAAATRTRDTGADMAVDAIPPRSPPAHTSATTPAALPATTVGIAPPAPAAGYKLTGILGSGSSRMALVNGQIVRVNDKICGATVLSITDGGVRLSEGGATFEVKLSR